MDYLELVETQRKIIDLEERFKNQISHVDERGNRKLDSRYFLSAETAAYKLLSSWVKRMRAGEDFIDESIAALVERMGWLADCAYGEDWEIYEAEYSMELWGAVLEDYGGSAYRDFNLEVIVMASFAEIAQGADVDNCLAVALDESDEIDPDAMSYAYSVAHDWIMSMSDEQREQFAQRGFGLNADSGLFKFHFSLFQ